jgi:hypothetical protein
VVAWKKNGVGEQLFAELTLEFFLHFELGFFSGEFGRFVRIQRMDM